jgi:predicted nucleic acid-binding protein
VVIVDSSVWIDYLANVENPETAWLDRRLTLNAIGLTDLVLCEVLQGFRSDADLREAKMELLKFEVFQSCGLSIAIASVENYRRLRSKGITVRKTIDCVIATFCIENGHVLLHRDRDFDPFEQHLGLQVIHP